jgi:general secretion pathway protein G
MNKNKFKAFTLIELLVVIAIIGILTTIAVIALNNARAKARDAKRIADVKQIQTALELFFNDMNRYPTAIEFTSGSIYSTSTLGTTTYMATIPNAPTPPDSGCTSDSNAYAYSQIDNGANYALDFCLGGNVAQVVAGETCASSAGFSAGGCCEAFLQPTLEGRTYNTVKIGTQCWLKQNLDVGARINNLDGGDNSDGDMTNNGIVEKYCFNDDPANCNIYGGLYQRSEAMQYSAIEGAQGICPSGWHVPAEAELYTLEQYLTDSPNTCDPNRVAVYDCANAGAKLYVGGSSGFDALLAGERHAFKEFYYQGTYAFFWSSSPDFWFRLIYADGYGPLPGVYRSAAGWNNGFSVRCLKD